MNKYLTTATLGLALIAVSPAFAEEPHNKEHANHHNKEHAHGKTDDHKHEHGKVDENTTKNEADKSVKKGPNKPAEYILAEEKVDAEVDKLRQSIVADALEAVVKSNEALVALEKELPKDAVAAIKVAIGKIAVTLKRDPTLGLKPIHVMKTVHNIQGDTDTIKKKIETAEKHLKEGDLQKARILLHPLASDMTISTTSIPLSTYPEGLKAVVPLIDAGKTVEAKIALQKLLSTLVTKKLVIPLPPLRAQALLTQAEVLTENEKRTADENKILQTLLTKAHNELTMSELLGYGDKQAFKSMHELLNEIEKKMADGKAGKGWFDDVKKDWSKLFGVREAA